MLGEQTLRAAEPAARRSDGAVRHEVEPDPERAPHRTRRLARLEVRAMRALEDGHVLVVEGEHVGGNSEALEVIHAQLGLGVGPDQRRVGVAPGAAIEQGACGLHAGSHARSMRRGVTFHGIPQMGVPTCPLR